MTFKAAIPTLNSGHANTDAFAQAVKQNLDWMTGQHKNSPVLKALAATATLADVIEQVNRLVNRTA